MKNEIEIYVPVSLDLDWPTAESVIEGIKKQNDLYGISNFFLACPGGGWRSKGYPQRADFDRMAELFIEVKEGLSGREITLGWWNTLTVKSGIKDGFTRIVRSNGEVHPFASCPLCEEFRRRFSQDVAHFAARTKPSAIIFEDDYSISAAAGPLGCFCENHLAEFARREQRTYTREELVHVFEKRDAASLALLKRYRALMRDSLVGLAESVRRELDRFDPEIPMGTMQSGGSDFDGDSTEALARALAGEKHTPFSRLYGAYYGGGDLKGIPREAYHSIYSKEHIGDRFKCISEADTFPHTRFFTSARQMKAFMTIAYSSGIVGSIFQTQQLLDDPNEELAYGKLYQAERARFSALADRALRCERVGVSLPHDPFYSTLDGLDAPHFCRTLDLFGIPYTTKRGKVTFLDERLAKYLPDEEILTYLSRGLFLDGGAARELCDRGFGTYIGVSVGEDIASGYTAYDLGAREVIKPPFDVFSCGKNMPIAHMYAPKGNGTLFALSVTDPKTEVISEAYGFDKRPLCIAMTRFVNALGGRVVVMGMTVKDNLSQSLFNYRRMRLFEELLKWCGADLPLVRGEPCVHLIFNRARNGEDFTHLLTAINLGDDPLHSLSLYLPQELREKTMLLLGAEGAWKEADATFDGDVVNLRVQMESCEPICLLFLENQQVTPDLFAQSQGRSLTDHLW